MKVNVKNLKGTIKNAITTKTSIMLAGKPGIGKTEVFLQTIKEFEKETNKKCNIKIIYLHSTLLEQLTGVPTPNGTWSKPEILNLPEGYDYYIFLFDDIHLADKNKQGILFQILTHHYVNGHKFPENSIFVLAGNGVEDNAGANIMLAPVVNRLLKFNVEADYDSWKNYLKSTNIEKKIADIVTSFLEYETNNKYFHYYNDTMENEPFPSPRSWTNMMNFITPSLDEMLDNRELFLETTSAAIGKEAATKLLEYVIVFNRFKSIDDLLAVNVKKLTSMEYYIYTISSAKFFVENINKKELTEKLFNLITKLDPTYIVLFLKKVIDATINKDRHLTTVKSLIEKLPENLKEKISEIFDLIK